MLTRMLCAKMRRIVAVKWILNRIQSPGRVYPYRARPFSSDGNSNKPTTASSGGGDGSSSSPSLSNYSEQYKALENIDFMSAAKILFSDSPKKKFGLDFHLVQLFFVCLPSLAVYLVAQYARAEMRKMDAELERKKQAEFEAQAKEMEFKTAEEKAAAASNPELLKVKERLDKLEVAVTEIVIKSKKQSDYAIKTEGENHNKLKQTALVEQDNAPNEMTSLERGRISSEGNTRGFAPDIHATQSDKNDGPSKK